MYNRNGSVRFGEEPKSVGRLLEPICNSKAERGSCLCNCRGPSARIAQAAASQSED